MLLGVMAGLQGRRPAGLQGQHYAGLLQGVCHTACMCVPAAIPKHARTPARLGIAHCLLDPTEAQREGLHAQPGLNRTRMLLKVSNLTLRSIMVLLSPDWAQSPSC